MGPIKNEPPVVQMMAWCQTGTIWINDGLITQTQDIISLVDAAWKHPKYPCICILPLEFEVNIDIHKHENSEVIQ